MVIKCRVRSIFGETIEKGQSTTINVRTGRDFVLSASLTQCVFGHLKHTDSTSYRYLQSNSGDKTFIEQSEIKVKIIDYHYEYNTYNGINRFKRIKVRNKYYVQQWEKKGNRFQFKERTKLKYDSRKKLNATSKEKDLV